MRRSGLRDSVDCSVAPRRERRHGLTLFDQRVLRSTRFSLQAVALVRQTLAPRAGVTVVALIAHGVEDARFGAQQDEAAAIVEQRRLRPATLLTQRVGPRLGLTQSRFGISELLALVGQAAVDVALAHLEGGDFVRQLVELVLACKRFGR